MEYTCLSDFPIRSGNLTLWRTEAETADAWELDNRPLTSQHEKYCGEFDSLDERPGRGKWIGTIFEMDAPLDRRAVRDLIWVWHARHEGLRTTARVAAPGARPARFTCSALGVKVIREVVDTVSDGDELGPYLSAEFERRLSPAAWPHCLVATVEHRDTDDFTVLVAADHSVMDAYGQALIINEFRALYRALLDGSRIEALTTCASSADYAVLERQSAATVTADCPATLAWRSFFDSCDGKFPSFPPLPSAVHDTARETEQHSFSRWLLDNPESDLIEAAATARGYRLTAVIFAALAYASYRVSGNSEFRTIMPVATRPSAQWAESMGWFVNIVPLSITVGPDQSFDSALHDAAAALKAVRPLTMVPAGPVCELLEIADTPRFGVSFVDMRRVPGVDTIGSLRHRLLRAESYSPDEVYFWVGRTVDGLNISTRFPAAFPLAEMDRFIGEFVGSLREFAGGAVPALEVIDAAVGCGAA
ncbi:condensation domain-containing protein [Nocardia brasiliensis]